METDPHLATIEEALDGLKDFQRATVETVYTRLFRRKQKSMLVADEVGLGKTVVAKGIIARALRERRRRGDSTPFKVTYICSNQIIAAENIGKLNVFPKHDLAKEIARRVAYLAYEPQSNSTAQSVGLVLNTLTPATSFDTSHGIGNWHERAIIYSLLCADQKLGDLRNGLACLLRGTVRRHVDDLRVRFEDHRRWPLRHGLTNKLFSRLRKLRLHGENFPLTRQFLNVKGDRKPSLYDATRDVAALLDGKNEHAHRHVCNELARELRRALIDCCLDYIDADLFILDEFQRFRNLIDLHSHDEESLIARKIFGRNKARILLLSATPFKAFTGEMDHANGEDHYRDFTTVLEFLTNGDKVVLRKHEHHRAGLYCQLLNLQKGEGNISTEHRDGLESILRSIICRTERQIVAADPSAMIKDKWSKEGIPCGMADVQNFVTTDQVAWVLSKVAQGHHHAIAKPIEYCKSSPHPLSYLDGYALKDLLKCYRRNERVRSILKQQKDAWLNVRSVNRYKLTVGRDAEHDGGDHSGHARLASLAEEAIGPTGAQLLWVPPSFPYYSLDGAFKDSTGFSKTLVFSGWVMVPRMLATLLSYEVERRTIGNPETREARERNARKYFPPHNKPNHRRHPAPLLVFRSEDGDAALARSMSNFCCLYPSPTLAGLYDPISSLGKKVSLPRLRQALRDRIADLMKQAGLSEYETTKGSAERWYWAAPLLLDYADHNFNTVIKQWLNDEELQNKSEFLQSQDGEQSGKRRHFDEFRNFFNNPNKIVLGRMPDDLPDVLADMAMGSPAITVLRTLRRLFQSDSDQEHLSGSLEIAGEFLNLFNKPESICAVRLSCRTQADYWRQVLRYSADGCLQAVLDEYGHLTKDQERTMEATVARMRKTVNITATSVNVDSLTSFLRGHPHKMRCHYAVDFGNQKLETDEGQKRATSIRENFNSPFRPFVLATTSIGQEGLDFHQYCRKIVHWNLPGNPIDLEQREGRINRYKGLVIRQEIARKYGPRLTSDTGLASADPWVALFALADHAEREQRGKCELVPYWHLDAEHFKIERIIPLYPFSRDHGRLAAILETLAIYRLAFGQPRQVELIEHLLKKDFSPVEIEMIREKLMINLSPITYDRSG